MTRRLLAVAGLVVATGALASAGQTAGSESTPLFNPPKKYYLALGDSITYGYQSWKHELGLPPNEFNSGYVDVFAARLRELRSDLQVVNYGCVGESTRTLLEGGCLSRVVGVPISLHDTFEGSQLEAALSFLRAHPGQVSPITLHLFGNDVRELFEQCEQDVECVARNAPAAIAEFAARMGHVVGALRAAAPSAEIVVIGAWSTSSVAGEGDLLIQAANIALTDAVAPHRVRFADVVPIFNPPDPSSRATAVCALTLLCTHGDGHPSDAGYRAIAEVVFGVSGYARLENDEAAHSKPEVDHAS